MLINFRLQDAPSAVMARTFTGKMGIKYSAVFMPYLPQRRDKHGEPCGLTRRRPYTVLRLFLTDHQDIRSVPSINVFFLVLYRGRHHTLGRNHHSDRLSIPSLLHSRSTKVTVCKRSYKSRSRYYSSHYIRLV